MRGEYVPTSPLETRLISSLIANLGKGGVWAISAEHAESSEGLRCGNVLSAWNLTNIGMVRLEFRKWKSSDGQNGGTMLLCGRTGAVQCSIRECEFTEHPPLTSDTVKMVKIVKIVKIWQNPERCRRRGVICWPRFRRLTSHQVFWHHNKSTQSEPSCHACHMACELRQIRWRGWNDVSWSKFNN